MEDLKISGVSVEGVELVKRTLRADPKERVSAADALEDEWFVDQRLVSSSSGLGAEKLRS